MTVLAEAHDRVGTEARGEKPRTVGRSRFRETQVGHRIRRSAAMALAGLLGLFVVWLICADPIAHVWYQHRQRSLTSQAISAGTQLGSQAATLGEQVGVLEDPTIGLDVVIAQGDSPGVLRGGPGHSPGTPLPGARGNSVVVGHAKDWGAPFKDLRHLAVGGTLYLQARPGVFKLPETGYFVYTVTSVNVVSERQNRLIANSDDYRLTLVTNAGGRLSGNKVLVVTAVSGTVGKVIGSAGRSTLEPPGGSLFSVTSLRFLVEGSTAVAVVCLLRRRHRVAVVLAVATPLVLLATWTLFTEFDMVAFRPLA